MVTVMSRKRNEFNYNIKVVNAGGELRQSDVRLFAKWLLDWGIANGSINVERSEENANVDNSVGNSVLPYQAGA